MSLKIFQLEWMCNMFDKNELNCCFRLVNSIFKRKYLSETSHGKNNQNDKNLKIQKLVIETGDILQCSVLLLIPLITKLVFK